MRRSRYWIVVVLASVLLAGGCGDGADGAPRTTTDGPTSTVEADGAEAGASVTTMAPRGSPVECITVTTETSTPTTIPHRLVSLPDRPPAWDVVTITTDDGIDLHGKHWPRGDRAVLMTHGYDSAATHTHAREPQSSDLLLTWCGLVADAGVTVLAIDWRGHGQSGGEFDVPGSSIDLKAAYEWLRGLGHDRVAVLAFFGSGPVAADLSARDPDVDFSGLGLLWTPPQTKGFDSIRSLPDIDEPVWIVAIDEPTQARWSLMLADKAVDLFDRVVLPEVPGGLLLHDPVSGQSQYINGEEFAGRLLTFVESV